MESQQPLGVDLVLLVQQLLLLSGQTKAGQAIEKDRYTMDCLYSQEGCRVTHVSLAFASMTQDYTQLYCVLQVWQQCWDHYPLET